MKADYLILEFDDNPKATIEPTRHVRTIPDMPDAVVMCFFQDVIQNVCKGLPAIAAPISEIGPNPVYALATEFGRVGVMHPGVGAPLAATFLEEAIALGATKFIACGGAGVLDGKISTGHVMVPTAAVRDEGTSYHYLPASREVDADPVALAAIETTLSIHSIPFDRVKTWTTDAIYRETPGKVQLRRAEGCSTVEMECATFFAVAHFRDVRFGQMLYGGDDVSSSEWDHRDWIHGQASTREKLFWLAVEAVTKL